MHEYIAPYLSENCLGKWGQLSTQKSCWNTREPRFVSLNCRGFGLPRSESGGKFLLHFHQDRVSSFTKHKDTRSRGTCYLSWIIKFLLNLCSVYLCTGKWRTKILTCLVFLHYPSTAFHLALTILLPRSWSRGETLSDTNICYQE